jgi:hypothetical protein
MKKTIVSILIIAIAAFTCFAVESLPEGIEATKTVKLNGSVSPIELAPVISLFGNESEGLAGVEYTKQSLSFTNLGSGGTAYFQIKDSTEVKLDELQFITVSASVDQWLGANNGETRAITLSAIDPDETLTTALNGVKAELVEGALKLTYAEHVYWENVNSIVATFTATWKNDADSSQVLGADTYTANVWITVTNNN